MDKVGLSAWHARGHRFDSDILHNNWKKDSDLPIPLYNIDNIEFILATL